MRIVIILWFVLLLGVIIISRILSIKFRQFFRIGLPFITLFKTKFSFLTERFSLKTNCTWSTYVFLFSVNNVLIICKFFILYISFIIILNQNYFLFKLVCLVDSIRGLSNFYFKKELLNAFLFIVNGFLKWLYSIYSDISIYFQLTLLFCTFNYLFKVKVTLNNMNFLRLIIISLFGFFNNLKYPSSNAVSFVYNLLEISNLIQGNIWKVLFVL